MNCGKPVEPDEAKLFAQTFVCPSCFKVAERFMQRGIHEANQMLVVLKEAIRVGLVRGELQFTTESVDDMKPGDLFQEMSRLADKAREAQRAPECQTRQSTPTTTHSRETSSPDAAGMDADGRPSSS